MALPVMATPTFKTKIPSTGQQIEFRPFLVREEKILLMALEGGDSDEMVGAIKKILDSCILNEYEYEKLATFDIEFLFLKLRAKSVGEVIDIRIGHTGDNECDAKTDVKINIDEIKVEGIKTSKQKTIMLTDRVGVKVRYPSMVDVDDANKEEENQVAFNIMARCIDVVFDNDNVYDDFSVEEMKNWLDTLNQEQFLKISEFFDEIPTLKHKIQWTCKKCGEKDSYEIEGLQSFFTLL